MNKKGFIFVETIVVLVITLLALALMLSSCLLIVRKTNINRYYNRPNELYALRTFISIGTSETNQYSERFLLNSGDACQSSSPIVPEHMSVEDCTKLLNKFHIKKIGYITDINEELSAMKDDPNILAQYDTELVNFINNLQTVEKANKEDPGVSIKYVIGEFYLRVSEGDIINENASNDCSSPSEECKYFYAAVRVLE